MGGAKKRRKLYGYTEKEVGLMTYIHWLCAVALPDGDVVYVWPKACAFAGYP